MTLAVRARAEADVLLHRLLIDRRLSERRCAETGRLDPLKKLTGRSSLDRAVAATVDMITHIDRALGRMPPAADRNGASVRSAAVEPKIVTVPPPLVQSTVVP